MKISENKNTPYTYLIGWKSLNKWYYGVRYSSNCNPSDLWKTYFTSSNIVKKFVEIHGDPDVVQIRKIFDSSEKARIWESKVLTRINAMHNEIFLNKTNNISIGPLTLEENGMYGKTHTDEARSKMSKRMKGHNNPMFGKNHSTKTIEKMKLAHTGRKKSIETKRKVGIPVLYNNKKYHTIKECANDINIPYITAKRWFKYGKIKKCI